MTTTSTPATLTTSTMATHRVVELREVLPTAYVPGDDAATLGAFGAKARTACGRTYTGTVYPAGLQVTCAKCQALAEDEAPVEEPAIEVEVEDVELATAMRSVGRVELRGHSVHSSGVKVPRTSVWPDRASAEAYATEQGFCDWKLVDTDPAIVAHAEELARAQVARDRGVELETAEAGCESCGHRTGLHYQAEHVRADRLTCRAFTCQCTHRPGQALVAKPAKRSAKPARAERVAAAAAAEVARCAATSARLAEETARADREREAGKVYASKLAAGQRIVLRGHGEVVVDRVETWEPRKVLVTLATDGEPQLVMGSWAWVRLAA